MSENDGGQFDPEGPKHVASCHRGSFGAPLFYFVRAMARISRGVDDLGNLHSIGLRTIEDHVRPNDKGAHVRAQVFPLLAE